MERIAVLRQLMAHGHCAASISMVHNTQGDISKLADTYFYFIKPCIQKDFPKLAFFREYIGKDGEKYGVYVDSKGEVAASPKAAFLGSSNVSFTATHYNIHQCWCRHDSQVTIVATDNSHLHIDCFENAAVNVTIQSRQAKVFINQYGNSKVLVKGFAEQAKITTYKCKNYK